MKRSRPRLIRRFVHSERDAEHVILLGIALLGPEEVCGWIEAGAGDAEDSLVEVRCFWEKPSRDTAKRLISAGCLWNSFVMAGRVSAFLNMIRWRHPDLAGSFESALTPGINELFSKIPASDFSHDVLSVRPSDLAVLPAHGLGWSDLGEPERVLSVARQHLGTGIRNWS
jgi:mannose-1-phosphate guanylyltransferase